MTDAEAHPEPALREDSTRPPASGTIVGVTGDHQPVRGTGLALRDPLPWASFSGLAKEAEGRGYAGVFVPEITGREAFATLAGLAAVTSSTRLGTGVVPMGSREPLATAMGAATVQELSGGRAVLGIGTGSVESGALDRLRAYVTAVRGLLGGATRTGPVLSLRPEPPPIWIAALGPRAMRLAGEIADGALLNWCPPERVAFAVERIREGAEAAGRDPGRVTVAVYVRASLGADEGAVLPGLRAMTGEYASFGRYRRQFEVVGLGEEAAIAAAAHEAGRPEDVPDGLVRAVCLLGDASAARARLEAFRAAGAHLPVVYPVAVAGEEAASVASTLTALAATGP